MATDKSDPRVALIFQVALVAIVGLLGARGFLQAYFDRMDRAEEERKIGLYPALTNMRADAKEHLSTGPMPIDKAMQMLATKGRTNVGPDIMPSASKDVAPLEGWTKMPLRVPPAMTAPPAPPPEPVPTTSASAASSAAPAGSQKPHQP